MPLHYWNSSLCSIDINVFSYSWVVGLFRTLIEEKLSLGPWGTELSFRLRFFFNCYYFSCRDCPKTSYMTEWGVTIVHILRIWPNDVSNRRWRMQDGWLNIRVRHSWRKVPQKVLISTFKLFRTVQINASHHREFLEIGQTENRKRTPKQSRSYTWYDPGREFKACIGFIYVH